MRLFFCKRVFVVLAALVFLGENAWAEVSSSELPFKIEFKEKPKRATVPKFVPVEGGPPKPYVVFGMELNQFLAVMAQKARLNYTPRPDVSGWVEGTYWQTDPVAMAQEAAQAHGYTAQIEVGNLWVAPPSPPAVEAKVPQAASATPAQTSAAQASSATPQEGTSPAPSPTPHEPAATSKAPTAKPTSPAKGASSSKVSGKENQPKKEKKEKKPEGKKSGSSGTTTENKKEAGGWIMVKERIYYIKPKDKPKEE
jgi:hypothetical protein